MSVFVYNYAKYKSLMSLLKKKFDVITLFIISLIILTEL